MTFLNDPIVTKNCFDGSGLSLKRLMVRSMLDTLVPMLVESASNNEENQNEGISVMKWAIDEAKKLTDSQDGNNEDGKEDNCRKRKRKGAAKACCPGVQMQIGLLCNLGNLRVMHESLVRGSDDDQCWPFSLRSLLVIGGHTANGTIAHDGRNPSLVTGSECRVTLLQLEKIFVEAKNSHGRKFQNVSSSQVKTAIKNARDVFGSFLPSEVGLHSMVEVDPDAFAIDEDQKDITETVKQKLDRSKRTTATGIIRAFCIVSNTFADNGNLLSCAADVGCI